jgi:hypothetical protein
MIQIHDVLSSVAEVLFDDMLLTLVKISIDRELGLWHLGYYAISCLVRLRKNRKLQHVDVI